MRRVVSAFRHAVPWLMLATTMRIIYATGSGLLEQGAFVVANLAIFLAFLIAAHQMIVLADGQTTLASLPFRQQIAIGRNIILRVTLLLAAISFAVASLGAPDLAPHLVYGFDGIAFDQFSTTGRMISAVLAAIVLLMVLASERGERATLLRAAWELLGRWRSLLPALAALVVFLAVLSHIQGLVRSGVQEIWQAAWIHYSLRAFLYFAFIFSFATLRLCGSLAILVLALRRSYRRGEGPPGGPGDLPEQHQEGGRAPDQYPAPERRPQKTSAEIVMIWQAKLVRPGSCGMTLSLVAGHQREPRRRARGWGQEAEMAPLTGRRDRTSQKARYGHRRP